MTTMADLVADVRRMTYGSMSERINLIATSASAIVDEVDLELDVTGISEGMILSSGLNVWYVKGISANDRRVFVVPGIDNAPVGGVSAGDLVYVRPRMTDWYAFNVLNDEIKSMSAPTNGLFKVGSWTVDSEPTYQTYEVPSSAADMQDLIRVRYRLPGTPDLQLDLPVSAWRWRPTATTNVVQLTRNIPMGTEVTFVYKGPFTAATSLSTNVITSCGLSESMVDIPALGAAAMLLNTTESRRVQVQTQGDARRADEVPATSNSAAARDLRRIYRERIQDEYVRLTAKYPIFKGV